VTKGGIGDPCVRVHTTWQAVGAFLGRDARRPGSASVPTDVHRGIQARRDRRVRERPERGKGAILRREGLYSSHVIEWTRARDAGRWGGGPAESTTPARKSAEQIELEKLRRQNEKLTSALTKTRMALDIMGKAHALLAELSESTDDDRPPRTS
jgi:transposase